MGFLVAPNNSAAAKRRLRGRSFRRGTAVSPQTSALVSRAVPDGGQRVCLALNRGHALAGIAVHAIPADASPGPLRRKYSKIIRPMSSFMRRSSICSQASNASVSSVAARLRRLEEAYDREQKLEQQDSLKSLSNVAKSLAPIMLGCQILTGTNDVAQTLGPAVNAIAHTQFETMHMVAHAQTRGSLSVGLHALNVTAPKLYAAPELSAMPSGGVDHQLSPAGPSAGLQTMGSAQLQQAPSMGQQLATATSFRVAGEALANMVQANTNSSEALPGADVLAQSKAGVADQVAHAHNLQSATRGAGAVLMRLDSMKKRTQKSVAMGLSKLWLSWYDHEHADNGGATCADCEPSPKPQAA